MILWGLEEICFVHASMLNFNPFMARDFLDSCRLDLMIFTKITLESIISWENISRRVSFWLTSLLEIIYQYRWTQIWRNHCATDFCIWRTIFLVPVPCISSLCHMYMTDFAYDGPIFLVPLSLSYPSSPVLLLL